MPARLLHHVRHNIISYVALFFALGGGSYAIAASTSGKTIHGCVVKGSGEMLIKARCGPGQKKLVWNQQGPPGRSPVTAWAGVTAAGFANPGHGISAKRVSTGVYNVTATPKACKKANDAPIVGVNAAILPLGSTKFPVAWLAHSGNGKNTFTVFTGVVAGGNFSPTDEPFNVQVPCS